MLDLAIAIATSNSSGGGPGNGLGNGLGNGARTICHCEREAFAAAVIVARMADAGLHQAPVWDDLESFDGEPWRGVVDCVCAGFPCQPWSVAGRGAGTDDDRWLWPSIVRIIAETAPSVVFLENTPGLLQGGKGQPESGAEICIADLAAMGYDVAWGVLSAQAVGASHLRKRVFILAVADPQHAGSPRTGTKGQSAEQAIELGGPGKDVADTKGTNGEGKWPLADGLPSGSANSSGAVADTAGIGKREPDNKERTHARERARGNLGGHGGAMADTAGSRCGGSTGSGEQIQRPAPPSTRSGGHGDDVAGAGGTGLPHAQPATGRGAGPGLQGGAAAELCGAQLADAGSGQFQAQRRGTGSRDGFGSTGPQLAPSIFAPGPADSAWPAILASHPYLAPAISTVRGVADGDAAWMDLAHRTDQLHAIGNSVVPLTAACAFTALWARLCGAGRGDGNGTDQDH